MKKSILAAFVAALVCFNCDDNKDNQDQDVAVERGMDSVPASANESSRGNDNSAAAAPDSAAMAKAMEAWMKPGDMHKWMAGQEGKWEGTISFCEGPGKPMGPPSKVTANYKMIYNGLYQESSFKANVWGMPFEGKGIQAYDNARRKFLSTWIDNMGSGVMYLEGDYDEGSKSITFTGKTTDPMTGNQMDFREVISNPDEKNQVMEMYQGSKGEEFKVIEIKLKKV